MLVWLLVVVLVLVFISIIPEESTCFFNPAKTQIPNTSIFTFSPVSQDYRENRNFISQKSEFYMLENLIHFSGNLRDCPKSLENVKCTESSCPRLSAAPGYGSGMSLNHGIPGQLVQEPQSLANNSLRAESFGAIRPRLPANGESGIANAARVKGRGVCSEPPWIPPQTPPKFSEQPQDKGTNCKVKL